MPKIKFSALAISNLKPQEKFIEYFDTGMPGFGLRVNPTGLKVWFILYRSKVDGKVKRYRIGKYPKPYSLQKARDEAKKKLGEISGGKDPHQKKKEIAASGTFGELFDDYMEHHARLNKRPSSIKEDLRIYDTYLKDWVNIKARLITRKDVIALHRSIKAPVMANRVLALVSTVFSKAIENELIDATPCVRIKAVMAKEVHRERILSDDEIRALWPVFDTLRKNMRDILKLILLTGQRPGEIMSMRVDELDMNQKIWTIPGNKTKNKQRHVVPLSSQVIKIIEPRITKTSPWIFPSKYNKNRTGHTTSLKKARQNLQEATKINSWTAHDLRRTARTLMSRFGVPPHIAEKVINHSAGRMVKVYDQFDYLDEKRQALDKLADGIMNIVSEKE